MAGFDAVIKIGGSLGRGPGPAGLGPILAALAGRYRLMIVPGGGQFADTVRACYRAYHLTEVAAHRMALLAMDQYGHLLADVLPEAVGTPDLGRARQIAAAGHVPVLLPAGLLTQADPLPNSWEITSDSLGAWIAGLAATPRFVLLKDVDGLFPGRPEQDDARQPPYQELRVKDLAAHRGGVDDYLATVLGGLDLETWVINGRHPERLAELLMTGMTLGTRIYRG